MRMRAGFALATGLMLVTGCGASGLETGAGTVEKKTAEAFLTTAETDWHQQVDAEPNKNLSADGRCYFVTGADGNKSLGMVACGPVRRLGTPERQVWDVVRVETTGGDKPGLQVPENEPWKQSQLRPDSSGLWRPDDKTAADNADALAAPPAPAAPAGMTEVSDRAETLDLKPATDKLVVPDGTVTLKGIATPATIGTGADAQSPASGEKFVVATFGTAPTIDQLTGQPAFNPQSTTTVGTKWTVTVGSQQRPVEVLPAADGSATTVQRTIVASVPKDTSEVLLTATNGPVVQSLSLISGKRTTDTAAAYYRTGTQAQLNKALAATSVTHGRDFRSTFSLSLGQAVLTPWDSERGWAPAGKAWVRVEVESQLEYPYVMYLSAWAASFLTATADGVPVSVGPNNPDADVARFAVPAGAKTVQIKAAATLNYKSNSYSGHNSPKAGSATYPALTATATFK
jgi:hypothetical protein